MVIIGLGQAGMRFWREFGVCKTLNTKNRAYVHDWREET